MASSVNGIIFSKDRTQVLIIQRRDVPVWVLPGGCVEENEDPEKAVIREIFEETGLTVNINRKVGAYTPINRLTTPTHLFECEIESGTPRTGTETRNIGFFPLQDLPRSFFHIHADMLQDALLKKEEVIQKPLSQVTYWKLFCYFIRHPLRVTRFLLSKMGFPINS